MTKLKIVIIFFKTFFFKKKLKDEVSVNNSNAVLMKNVDFHNSEIGDYSYVSNNSIVHNTIIGKFCSIGPNVVVGFGNHPIHQLSTSPAFYSSDCSFDIKPLNDLYLGKQTVHIGNDVWLGANVFVKNGVTIGHGAIIGAGAVVLKDIPPYAVVVGVPGSIKSYRFSENVIEKLLLSKWWDLSPKIIKDNFELFTSDKIIDSLESILKLKN
ncbi:CatB-related O-acetyltransferase [Flavobacterium sp. B183]|uniref:CatB-related O-acetyltransferase n=1 Tax=Flavobacterium sp. B183 TaxID=907046 RepID=UPI00201F8DC4|nr:CatB-related O-acetyltransferase [Flavobacterium sp. B183]URC13083.1 CatB-related O-acetyltransferase [Flavobacterium sp. B183]